MSSSEQLVRAARRSIPPAAEAAGLEEAKRLNVAGTIHPDDFIFWFIADQRPAGGEAEAAVEYVRSGQGVATYLAALLQESRISEILAGRKDPGAPVRLLEFAAGYGRVTRHLPAHLPGVAVTACDIHPQAVDYLRGLGFAAEGSAHTPGEFDLGKTFDVIFVFSFFTHMPRRTWSEWLHALKRHLADGGLLMFTAHGEVSQRLMGVPQLEADGFFFHAVSEQRDLETAEYGNTVTAFEFVQSQLPRAGLRLIQFRQAAMGHHDLYVVRNEPEARFYDAPAGTGDHGSRMAELESRLWHIENSNSWRITAPLRRLVSALRR